MEIIAMLGSIGGFILFILAIILPISAYCAQKWAYKCYKELVKINKHLSK